MAWFRALAEADSQAAEAQQRCNELAAAVAAAEGRAAGADAAREAAEQDLQREVQRWKLQAEAASRAAKLMDHSSSASARETTEEVNDLRQHVGDVVALFLWQQLARSQALACAALDQVHVRCPSRSARMFLC